MALFSLLRIPNRILMQRTWTPGGVRKREVHVQPFGSLRSAIFLAFSELQGVAQYQELIDLGA